MKNIIEVRGLAKCYRIGARAKVGRSLREAVMDSLAAPMRNFKRMQLPRRSNWESSCNGDGFYENDLIWALNDVSFDVKKGESLGIIGRNGCGKSTLLKLLSRITEPTRGEAKLYGRVSSLLEAGAGFHPELTGRENIYLYGTILGMRKSEVDRNFDAIVAFSEVERLIDTPVKHYSSGMIVRLAFAVGAHLEPEIFILDEVFAVGDADFQRKCIQRIRKIIDSGNTILFVSHDMTAIKSFCTRCLLLKDGRISIDGACADVISHYVREEQA